MFIKPSPEVSLFLMSYCGVGGVKRRKKGFMDKMGIEMWNVQRSYERKWLVLDFLLYPAALYYVYILVAVIFL